MDKLHQFILDNAETESTRLVLNKDKYPEIDIDLAINTIESRRRIKKKLPTWYAQTKLIYPIKLSTEQASSEATAKYKAEIIKNLGIEIIADLTGGMGVDSWSFSKVCKKVIYNEMQEELATATKKNYKQLNIENVVFSSLKLDENNIDKILGNLSPDMIFLDPARRGDMGRKVFRLEDCQPDVLKLKEHLLKRSKYLMLKLSPMADIDMIIKELGFICEEIHIISQSGECKELLVLIEEGWKGKTLLIATDLDKNFSLKFTKEDESDAICNYLQDASDLNEESYLLEPSKSITKAGGFKILSSIYGYKKLAPSTHLYLVHKDDIDRANKLGKLFKINEVHPFDKSSIKSISIRFPRSEVSAKNLPLSSDELRKKLGIKSGDDAHIWGLGTNLGRYLFVTKRIAHFEEF